MPGPTPHPTSAASRPVPSRDYTTILAHLSIPRTADRLARMQAAVDALWDALHSRGVSWIGFYLKVAGKDEMVLGPRRDKPACSPIGLHGVCGRGWQERRPIVVRDVATLATSYIACDPHDRSEVVVPVLDPDGSCWGVLDADSHDVGAFGDADAAGLMRVVERAGLTTPAGSSLVPMHL